MWLLSNKVTVSESGLLDGFRDCHCHLVPGVDDGVDSLDETIEIIEEWESENVKEVWMTPHIMEDMPNEVEGLTNRFRDVVTSCGDGMTLHLAAEHMMDGLFLQRLEANDVMPIGKDRNKLLVETSYYTPPMYMEDIVSNVKRKGYYAILAHPERYQYMEKSDYRHWKQQDVLLQLNVPSLVGAYGPIVQKKAEWLLKENMYDYCGSDTHSMEQVRMFLASEISKKTVKQVKKISENQEL